MTASPRSSLDLSSRRQFPDGLRVLLLDTAAHASETAQLLLDQRYQPVIAEDVQHAVTLLNRQADGDKDHLADAFDVILADLSLLSCRTDSRTAIESQDIWTAAKLVPIIIMGETVDADEILQAINQGAADFLQKPLTQRCMRNIWQHTVRRLMGSATPCSSGSCTPRSARHSLQGKEQACGQQLPSTATAPRCPAGQHHLLHPQLHDCMPADVALAGLELPPLLPSQLSFDPDTIFQDLERSPHPGAQEPSLDDLFCTGSKQCDSGRPFQPGVHPDKFVVPDDLLSGGGISQHDCSGSTLLRACGECEAADISSAAGSGMTAPAERSSVVPLRMQTSLRSWQSSAAHLSTWSTPGSPCTTSVTAGDTAGSVNQADRLAHPVAAVKAPPYLGSSAGCLMMPPSQMMAANPAFRAWWEAQSTAKGMVWGMPMLTVAKVPGIVVSGPATQSSYASASSGRGGTGEGSSKAGLSVPATGVPVLPPPAGSAGFMLPPPPQMCWPMMASRMLPAAPAAATATAGQPAAAGTSITGAGWAAGSSPWMFSSMMPGACAGMAQQPWAMSNGYSMQHMAGSWALAVDANWGAAPTLAVPAPPAAAEPSATGLAAAPVAAGIACGTAVPVKSPGMSLAALATATGGHSGAHALRAVRQAAAGAHCAGPAELLTSSKDTGSALNGAAVADMCRSGSLDSGILEVEEFNLFSAGDDLASLPSMLPAQLLLGLDGCGLDSLVC